MTTVTVSDLRHEFLARARHVRTVAEVRALFYLAQAQAVRSMLTLDTLQADMLLAWEREQLGMTERDTLMDLIQRLADAQGVHPDSDQAQRALEDAREVLARHQALTVTIPKG